MSSHRPDDDATAPLPQEEETDPASAAEADDPTSAPSDGRTGPRPDLPHEQD